MPDLIACHLKKENEMKRITTELNESEAMTVRRAVCAIAGAERVVITPLPYRMFGVDMVDVYSEQILAGSCRRVRLEVMADDSMAGSIVAVIRKIAHAGRVMLASRLDRQPRLVAQS
jgi:hypothetical protein